MKRLAWLLLVTQLLGSAQAGLNVTPRMPVAVATSHQWVSAISASGATTLSQPAYSDLSGTAPTSNDPRQLSNLGFAVTASTTLTVALKQADGSTDPASGTGAVVAGFRSATTTSGAFSLGSFTAATSIAPAAADSLGCQASVPCKLYIYLVSDTTSEICLSFTYFNDFSVQSASALTGSADTDATKMWCTSAHTSKPIRLIGVLTATWSNPNWGTLAAPTAIEKQAEAPPPIAWSGYTGYSSSTSSSSYAAFSNASSTITETNNANFGTVTTVTNQPGINFTPTDSGPYHICANAYMQPPNSSSANAAFQLWNNTDSVSIVEAAYRSSTTTPSAETMLPLCSIFVVTKPGTALAFQIRGKTSAGSVSIYAGTGRGAVEWEIFKIR